MYYKIIHDNNTLFCFHYKVLLDLHGAPGSQNGQDHSGHTGDVNWLNNRTIVVLGQLSGIMEKWITEGSIRAETLYGIELLNEPASSMGNLWDTCKNTFYPNGYHKIRDNYFKSLPDDKKPWVTIMGGFKANSEFFGYMAEPNFHYVSLDQHLYQCFGDVSIYLFKPEINNPEYNQPECGLKT